MSKILFPAIDLKDGECVRLKLGDMNEATVYNQDPGAQAKAFEDQGFKWLHVVDLNGAFEGETINGKAVEAILGQPQTILFSWVEEFALWIIYCPLVGKGYCPCNSGNDCRPQS